MADSLVDIPDYARIDQVRPIPRLRDWSRLPPEEFSATYGDQPVVFEGLAKQWRPHTANGAGSSSLA